MKNKFLAILAILLGGLFVGVFAVSAFDASEMDSTMTISPPLQRIILTPGETYNGTIVVFNPNAAKFDLKYSVTVGPYGFVRDEDGNMDYSDTDVDTVTSYNQMMDWISLDKDSGVVSPNSKDIIAFTIDVPENAPAGGQYATIIVQDDTGEESEGGLSIKNVIRFASAIIADVAGETKKDGEILENNVPDISFSTPLTVSSIVKNDGNIHEDAEYILQVYPLFSDEEIFSNEEQPMTNLIMPESSRYNTLSWDAAPMVGIFKVRQTVKIFGDESVVEKIVLICPLWLLLLGVFIVLAVVAGLFLRAKARKKVEKST